MQTSPQPPNTPETWGPPLWLELHHHFQPLTILPEGQPITDPRTQTTPDRANAFLDLWQARIPCQTCLQHWLTIRPTLPLAGPGETWAWTAHNLVNQHIGKPQHPAPAPRNQLRHDPSGLPIPDFINSTMCRSRVACKACRTNHQFRQQLHAAGTVPDPDFPCPYAYTATNLPQKQPLEHHALCNTCGKQSPGISLQVLTPDA